MSKEGIDYGKIGYESLAAFVAAIQEIVREGTLFDAIVGAGDSGQLAAYITEEVYRALGVKSPAKLVAPIQRHLDEEETVRYDNRGLVGQLEAWRGKKLASILFVDDEIGGANALMGLLDLLGALGAGIARCTVVAEDGGFECPRVMRGVQMSFRATKQREEGVYNAISYSVPWELQKPVEEALMDEGELSDKQVMCVLLGLPNREWQDGQMKFTTRLLEKVRARMANLELLQGQASAWLEKIVSNHNFQAGQQGSS